MSALTAQPPPLQPSSVAVRLLRVADLGEPGLAGERLAYFTRIFLLLIAVDHWHGLSHWPHPSGHGFHVLLAVGVSACAALAWRPGALRWAAGLAALPIAIDLVWAFPDHANHQYLALLVAGLVALFDPDDPAEAGTALAGLRWLVVIGLGWAGLQKVLWGYYFDGTFLSFVIAQRESFAWAFQWILPDGELARLQALALREGAGPFRAESLWLDLAAVGSWVSEIVLAAGLLIPRTRALAALGAMGLIAIIEVAARELFFGLIMFDFLVLFLPGRAGRRGWPLFALAGAILLASVLGWLPDWTFT
ncbi:MAG: hypothetical protein ACQGVK_15210 [Myxococcota bacterium]